MGDLGSTQAKLMVLVKAQPEDFIFVNCCHKSRIGHHFSRGTGDYDDRYTRENLLIASFDDSRLVQ